VRQQRIAPHECAVHAPRETQVFQHGIRFVLYKHSHVVDAGIDDVAEDEVNDAVLPAEKHNGLCASVRQSQQTLALAAGENERKNLRHGHP